MKKTISCMLTAGLVLLSGSASYAGSYTVEKGDSLWKISQEKGVTWQQIAEANNLANPSLIYPGQLLQLPDGSAAPVSPQKAEPKEAPKTETPAKQQESAPAAVDPQLAALYSKLDVNFAADVATNVAAQGTHPELGYRNAGSAGEYAAADYLFKKFKEVGLENVTKHETKTDTWSMTKSDLIYTDAAGKEQKIILGGYQNTFQVKDQSFDLIYLNKGTAADYERIDAKGKVILIDIDQSDDWWINWPAYQAKVKGAAAVIAVNTDGYAQLSDDTILIQDMCGPADTPAMSISKKDADVLKKLIEASADKNLKVRLTVDSKVEKDGKSHNISGEIPGKNKDEIIFVMAHYDGYFHAWHDDASGVGLMLSLAKAVKDSGYQPEKTLVFVTHGAEEWGLENSRYDWAIGAYEQITTERPDWAEKGFSVINCESGCARDDDKKLCIGSVYELKKALTEIVSPMATESPLPEGAEIYSPATVWSEDFPYARAGVPGMVTRKTSGQFNLNSYHTNKDLKADHYSEPYYQYSQKVYGTILYNFDQMLVKPLDFSQRLKDMKADISKDYCVKGAELTKAIDGALANTDKLTAKIDKLNSDYKAALREGDAAKIETLKKEGKQINKSLFHLFKDVENNLTALDWEDNVVFPHTCLQQNLENLDLAAKALKEKDAAAALDEYLSGVDLNWYAYNFDKETYTFFVEQTTKQPVERLAWGKGMLRQGNEDLFDVIHSLQAKAEDKNADFSGEIAALEKAIKNQQSKGEAIVGQQIKDVEALGTKTAELL